MRKNFGAKAWLFPQPVLIISTYGEDGVPDAMNAAWGGISDETQITICLGNDHKTVKNLLKTKAFAVHTANIEQAVACDYVGMESGNDVPNKFEKAGFHAVKSEFVNAPIIEELPMALECKVISYDDKTCRLVGEIVNVTVKEEVLDANGNIDPVKLQPIVLDPVNGSYLSLGDKVANAFSDGMKLK